MSEGCLVDEILKDCLAIHTRRDASYGESVFEDTAKIATILVGYTFNATEMAACLAAHKLARYAYQKERGDSVGTSDTIRDLINFLALTERERHKHVNKKRIITTPKAAPKLRDRIAVHTDLSGIKSFVPPRSAEKSPRPEDS